MLRLTEEEYAARMRKKKNDKFAEEYTAKPIKKLSTKKNKYGARATVVDGIRFHSQREADRYSELKLMKRDGQIEFFLRQVPFDLPGGIRWFADFMIFWKGGDKTIEDAKGVATPVYKIKKKQVEALYPVEIVEV